MDITVHISEKDYLHYAFTHMRKWRSVYLYIILLAGLTCLGIYAIGISPTNTVSWNRVIGIVSLTIALFYSLLLISLWFKLKAEYKSSTLLKHDLHFHFTTEGFKMETEVSHVDIVWENVVKVRQSEKVVALYISGRQAYLIPKAQLLPADLRALLKILKENLPAHKYK